MPLKAGDTAHLITSHSSDGVHAVPNSESAVESPQTLHKL